MIDFLKQFDLHKKGLWDVLLTAFVACKAFSHVRWSYVSYTFGRLEISINVSRKKAAHLSSHYAFSPCIKLYQAGRYKNAELLQYKGGMPLRVVIPMAIYGVVYYAGHNCAF
jgi:hypothetical protein